jgi:shikimate kinase
MSGKLLSMNHHAENIILIGMSGAGKSTLGVLLAKALGMNFVDTDLLIQQQEKRLLQNILDEDGIPAFLRIEETVVSDLTARDSVIATGGSVVYSEKAMQALKHQGKIVYLYVPYEELRGRLPNATARGIVIKKGSTLRDVYNERLPLYAKYSDYTINCSKLAITDCLHYIIEEIPWAGKNENLNGKFQ